MGWGAPAIRGCVAPGKPEVGGKRGNVDGVMEVMEVTPRGKLLLGDVGGELLLGVTRPGSFLSTEGFELSKESIQKDLFSLVLKVWWSWRCSMSPVLPA